MDEIAAKADYSKSTVYVYFKSKEEIYDTIVFESMKMLKNRLQNILQKNTDFKSFFFAICREMTVFQREYPLYFDSILGEISVKPEDFERCPVLREIYCTGEEINQMISEKLTACMANGSVRSEPSADSNDLYALGEYRWHYSYGSTEREISEKADFAGGLFAVQFYAAV